jgi:Ca-activated chloride channel homolog
MIKLIVRAALAVAFASSLTSCSSSADSDSAPIGAVTPTPNGTSGSSGSSAIPGGGGFHSGTGGSTSFGGGGSAGSSGSGGAIGTSGSAGATAEDPSNQGDNFQPVGTNPFVIVAHDPLSTFGADVDTASYDIFRRDIDNGQLPVPASVRLEDYVNYFAYDYPAPAAGEEHPFRISLGAAPHLLARNTALVRVGVQTTLPAPFQKKPANLVFLVDVSGSMQSADKLPLVEYTLTETLSVLEPTDRVSIVTYAGSTEVKLPPTPVSERSLITTQIAGLFAGGSTNGAGGIQLAYQQARAGFIEGGINHVILCTDGDFNVGTSSTDELVDLIVRERQSGVTLTVLGYGVGNLNDAMMEAVSNKGNGIYGVITDQDQAERYVHERMLSTLEHVARDMKIQVEFNPAHVHAYRLLGYENRAIADQDFRDDAIDAGEVGEGRRVTALYELVFTGQPVPGGETAPLPLDGAPYTGLREVGAGDVMLVKVRYKQVDATEADAALEVAAALAPEQMLTSFHSADPDLRWAIALAGFAEILKHSPYADPGHLDVIQDVAAEQAARDFDRTQFLELFMQARALLAQ